MAGMKVQELLAANVKLARGRMGISQIRLAEIARLSPSFIGEIEGGKKFPSAENLERLSEALGLRPYQLIYEAEDWEVYDKYDQLGALRIELKQKIDALLEDAIRRHLRK